MKKWDRILLLTTAARSSRRVSSFSTRGCTTSLISAHHHARCEAPCSNVAGGHRAIHSSGIFTFSKSFSCHYLLACPHTHTHTHTHTHMHTHIHSTVRKQEGLLRSPRRASQCLHTGNQEGVLHCVFFP